MSRREFDTWLEDESRRGRLGTRDLRKVAGLKIGEKYSEEEHVADDDERSFGPWHKRRKNPAMMRDWLIIDPDNRENILTRGRGGKPKWVHHKRTWGEMGDQEELRYTTAKRATNAAQRIFPWATRWEVVTVRAYLEISERIRKYGGN
jgi:hypothetical protein